MATVTIPKPLVMEFELDRTKTFKEVRHYNLTRGEDHFSEKINLSVNRGFSKAKYTYSLKIWQEHKWSKQITGLFPTYDPEIFYGDTEDKSHLLIVRFIEDGARLRLFHFQNFYTRHITDFLQIFKEHY